MHTNVVKDLLDDGRWSIVEWIDGERIPLEEYEARLACQQNNNAARYLLQINPGCNWIFGIDFTT